MFGLITVKRNTYRYCLISFSKKMILFMKKEKLFFFLHVFVPKPRKLLKFFKNSDYGP